MQKKLFRAFFAIDLPRRIKKSLADKIRLLATNPSFSSTKWVRADKLHLTLVFLGNISSEQHTSINQKVKETLNKMGAIDLEAKELQLFPSAKKPRALILKPKATGAIEKMVLAIRRVVREGKIQLERRRFRPHITLGRLNGIKPEFSRADFINNIKFKVNKIKLFSSEAGPTGSIYIPLAIYKLKKKL